MREIGSEHRWAHSRHATCVIHQAGLANGHISHGTYPMLALRSHDLGKTIEKKGTFLKLTQRLPWPFALAARIVCYSIALAIIFYQLHGYASFQLMQHTNECRMHSYSGSPLTEVKGFDACLAEKSGLLDRFLLTRFHKAVAALPNAPSRFVGSWTSTQPHCTYRFTLAQTGEFEADPIACNISSQHYSGLWGVDADKMIWIAGVNGRLDLTPDVNPIESATDNSFILVEQDGSRTKFVRDASEPSAVGKDASNAAPGKNMRLDVWKLREEVAALEAIEATDNTDPCYPETDDSAQGPTPKETEEYEKKAAACVEKTQNSYAAYRKAWEAFNAKWLPLFREAIQHGDQVAEVIMRQCETTSVLDRHAFETTCDEDSARRSLARKRLVEIGFLPALDLSDELNPGGLVPADSPRQRELNQLAVMKKFRGGALGFNHMLVDFTGNAGTDGELALARRWALMEAISQDAPRAFTFIAGYTDTWNTDAFATLRLNRKPTTPGYMTWGPAMYYGGGKAPYTGPRYWRLSPEEFYSSHDVGSKVAVAGRGVVDFEQSRTQLLAEIESYIHRYLTQDPRWGVFLIRRIGFHEWVPEGMASQTGQLDPSWEGNWILEKEGADWARPLSPASGHAQIRRQGDRTLISMATDHHEEPLQDVEDCELRYSGGSTYLPKVEAQGQDLGETLLGDFYANGPTRAGSFLAVGANREAVAPFDPQMRYRQVLMQCGKAEAPDATRVRFLLLAGDTLVEFAAARPFDGTLAVRHYRREH
ncbi:hypothetical protein [Dyella choica]|uniref:Uncharacterized protein n=1 Tax=Dyella choica TaxID=1927959 RepID=A0A432M8C9_9GAMM|nr:hypothetical protein [Dyella choica]RUL78151.1 hypothetical protein EKH80_04700 [Dyella choica]